MNAFNIFPRKLLVAYLIGVTLILFAALLGTIVGTSQISGVEYAATGTQFSPTFGGNTLITQQNSKAIYTSSVPQTVADALNFLSPNSAYPMTVSLTVANQSTSLVIRGLPLDVIQSEISNSTLSENSSWIMLGYEAASELHARVGSVLSISSPFADRTFSLSVSEVFSLDNETDYEGIVSLSLGQEIAGLQNGVANAIVLEKSIPKITSMIGSNYALSLNYSGVPGSIDIVDSSGYVHDAFTNSSEGFILPFGLYTAVLDQNGIRTPLKTFVPTQNGTIVNLSTRLVSGTSLVSVKSNSSPKLLNSQNATILPFSYDNATGYWAFRVENGPYTLLVPGEADTKLTIFGNASYDPNIPTPNSVLNVTISNDRNPFYITVKNAATSTIVYSSFTSLDFLEIPVQANQTYTVSVLSSDTNLLLEQNITIGNGGSLNVNFPNIPYNLRSVPISDYASLGIGGLSKSATFDYLVGGVIASTTALFGLILVLLGASLFVLARQLVISLRGELAALCFMFPSRGAVRSKVKLPLFALALSGGIVALVIAEVLFYFFKLSSSITFLGYGIESYPLLVSLGIILVFVVLVHYRISALLDREIFGKR